MCPLAVRIGSVHVLVWHRTSEPNQTSVYKSLFGVIISILVHVCFCCVRFSFFQYHVTKMTYFLSSRMYTATQSVWINLNWFLQCFETVGQVSSRASCLWDVLSLQIRHIFIDKLVRWSLAHDDHEKMPVQKWRMSLVIE